MKKLGIGIVVVFVVSALAFSVCAQEKKSPFIGDPEETYYMCVMVSGVEYWFPVYEMFKQAGQQLGVKTVYTGTPEYDVNKQIAVFDQILAKKPAGILLHPMNSDPFIEPINRAAEMGIPVVTFAADSPLSKRVSYVTSDNYKEAALAAKFIAEDMGGVGEVAVLENPGQDNHDRRTNGFIQSIEANYPKMKVVGRVACNQDPNKGYQAVLTLAQAHPELGAVFMPEAVTAIGAAQAAKELGGKIRVVCCDVSVKILDMIKAGEIFAAINPDQGVQGYMGMLLLYLAKHSDMIDPMNDWKQAGYNPMSVPYLDNGMHVVNKDNADFFYWEKYLAQRGTKGINE
ncbi:putative ABC transporter periplasmic sugar-binding protein [Candidatus Vecturithrix granuli]|uniref:Putative ABC transporter periplasmic sugar-binding protein n=1 Tax=Vecturithrix granuli TaxID=1499967 RepID=A0A0S6WAE7_VECG1|nr:putative ABC transporter periplasmic sugar-binding protein [Candidatus Vecturithrix granuli]